MTLTAKEKTVAIISNGIAVYSMLQERDELPKGVTIHDFILKAMPKDLMPEITAELIDEVFEHVSSSHNS